MTGDTITTGLIIGFAALALFWLTRLALDPSKSRNKGPGFLLVFAVALMTAMKWFSP